MLPFVGEVCTDSSSGARGEDKDEEEAPADCAFSSLLTLSISLDLGDPGLKRRGGRSAQTVRHPRTDEEQGLPAR
jgi:hypothetical protein